MGIVALDSANPLPVVFSLFNTTTFYRDKDIAFFLRAFFTVEHVARALLNHNELRIITNSLRVAHILYKNPRYEVMVLGGTLLEFDVNEASVAKIMMRHSRHILLAADHTKYHASAAVDIGNITQAAALFTDEMPPAALKARLKESQVEIILSGEDGVQP